MILCEWNDIPKNMKNEDVKKYYDFLSKRKCSLILKRTFDFFMAIVMLVLLSPFFLILSVLIKADSNGPVFYRQERITQYGITFKIFKFRTMVVNADIQGSLVTTKNDTRITRVGKKIRKVRLDEIPQLINVLKGEMSFVGTRPEVKKYVDYYTNEMKATLLLPAGITSLASIEFKDEDTLINEGKAKQNIDILYVEDILPLKMHYNLVYLQNVNILFDLKLCFKTILEVIK